MDLAVVTDLVNGFGAALKPENLLLAALGVTLGTFVGVLPGIGPALTIALLLPLTFNFSDPTGAFIMFAGIYAGGMYGGSTTSILLNTPGESSSVATAIEGFQMAKRGRAKAALSTAALGSFVAGTISIVLLTLVAQPMADLAVKFQPPDYFWLAVLALVSVAALFGRSLIRGFSSLFIGLVIGCVGIDQVSGQSRLALGVEQLNNGIDIVLVAIGLFAVGEALQMAARLRRSEQEELIDPDDDRARWLSREDARRSWKPWVRGAAIGFPFGALPAGGAEIPTFLSYSVEKRLSKHPEEFGSGAIEGVAGPEAANNASFSGTLVPLLTLGIPTSATAAIMLSAFQIFNLQPGPELFTKQSDLVWALIASLYVGNLMLLVLNLPLIRVWVKILEIPRSLLYAGIMAFGVLGAYALSNSPVEVLIMLALGGLGFLLRRGDFPIAPVVLGVILGPLMESQFRRTLIVSDGDLGALVSRPLSQTLMGVAVFAVALPYLPVLLARLRGRPAPAGGRFAASGGDD